MMNRPRRRELLKAAALSPAFLPGGGWRQPLWEVAQESQGPEASPRVDAFERMAFGMFLHWGLYSQLAVGEWAKKLHGIGTPRYMELMKTFRAEGFDAREVARVARSAGMRYATLTTRHHDGFSLYDTRKLSKYDVTGTPAKRDLVLEFAEGCRAEGIVPMFYCTTLDWTDPRFESDWDAYQQYLRDSIKLLCTEYGDIGGFWFDGNWSRKDADWQLDALYGLIRRHQPEALIINNTGLEKGGLLGHGEIDSVTFERGRPANLDHSAMGKYVAGEMCHTFNFHWGIAANDFNYLSPAHVIEELCGARRYRANLLMNVGPTAAGEIPAYERAALARVGDWIALHGGDGCSLYDGAAAGIEGRERDFGLRLKGAVDLYVHDLTPTADSRHGVTSRGPGSRVFTGVQGKVNGIKWLDDGSPVQFTRDGDGALTIEATKYPYGTNTVVRIARATFD